MTENEEIEKQFFSIVDEFIHLANSLAGEHGVAKVSTALLFAASRFNAHHFYSTNGAADSRPKMVDYHCEQYRHMLEDNLEWMAELRGTAGHTHE